MPKNHRRSKPLVLNRVEIPLHVQRDTILNEDATYLENVSSLKHNINTGLVPKEMFGRIQPSLVMAALRRAGQSLRLSEAMLRA